MAMLMVPLAFASGRDHSEAGALGGAPALFLVELQPVNIR